MAYYLHQTIKNFAKILGCLVVLCILLNEQIGFWVELQCERKHGFLQNYCKKHLRLQFPT